MLRIVHPAPAGQPTRPRKRRRAVSLLFTPEETQHYRAALRNIARAYGGMTVLAGVVGVPVGTLQQPLYKARRRPSAIVALRVAKAAGMHLETLLSGQLSEAGRCKACGSRVGDGAARRAS